MHMGREGQAGSGHRVPGTRPSLWEREERAGVTDWALYLGDIRSEERMERQVKAHTDLQDRQHKRSVIFI